MARVFILPRRSDIPSGYLQIKDLYPNKSNYSTASGKRLISNKLYITQPLAYTNPVIEQNGEGEYVLMETYSGVGAGLLVTKTNADGTFLSNAQLENIYNDIVTLMYNAGALDGASLAIVIANKIDIALNWTTASFGANNGWYGSTEVLQVLAGTPFSVPAGTVLAPASGVLNSLDIAQYYSESGDTLLSNRSYFVEDSLRLSYLKGDLHKMLSSHFIAYDPNYEPLLCNDERYIEGAAITIYTEFGTVYSYP